MSKWRTQGKTILEMVAQSNRKKSDPIFVDYEGGFLECDYEDFPSITPAQLSQEIQDLFAEVVEGNDVKLIVVDSVSGESKLVTKQKKRDIDE